MTEKKSCYFICKQRDFLKHPTLMRILGLVESHVFIQRCCCYLLFVAVLSSSDLFRWFLLLIEVIYQYMKKRMASEGCSG